MSRTATLALLLGVVITLGVIAIDVAGGFAALEVRTLDLRFTSGLRPSTPMSDRIVHVDVDDRAIERLGRWPWDRSRLAEAIEELARAGATTIALDLYLGEEQQYPEGSEAAIDHDARLVAALGRAPCLLAVIVHDGALFGPDWDGAQGRRESEALLRLLARDVCLDELSALDAARVTGVRRRRVRMRPMAFRRAAAWLALDWAETPPDTFEAFEDLVAPNRPQSGGAYPERPMLERIWSERRAWAVVKPLLKPSAGRGTFEDAAPLPMFAEQASAVGFVNFGLRRHADGIFREIAVAQDAPRGTALQFGLAAAARYLGLEPGDVEVGDGFVRCGEVTLPLHEDRLWIAWPTSATEPRWLGLLRQREDDPETRGHLTISEVIELRRSRDVDAGNRRLLAETTARILAYEGETFDPDDLLGPDTQATAADSVAFTLGVEPGDPAPPAQPDETAHEHDCRIWLEVSTAVREDAARIALNEARLRDAVAGRLVFVGWTATGAQADFVPTALGPRTPGVIVHSAVASMALTGHAVRFLEPWRGRLLIALLGMLATVAAARFATLLSGLLVATVLGLYVYLAWGWLFAAHELAVPIVAPVVGGATAWIACIALLATLSQRDRRRITRQFRSRVSAQLVDFLVENPDALSVSGEEREMTVMFGDLVGFTAISERLGGQTTVSTLNRYLGELTEILIAKGAYMNKFLGDGYMAFWSAFAVDQEQAAKACRGALNCQSAVRQLNDDPAYADLPSLGLRIGIGTGRVVVGDCGAPPALNDYTVIGDAVNLASRLEAANKQFGTRILINARTCELLPDDELRVRPIGRIVVVGQSVPVDVFEVMPPETPDEIIEATSRVVTAFRAARLDEAAAALEALAAIVGPSPLAEVYRDAIAAADDSFDGVLRLREK